MHAMDVMTGDVNTVPENASVTDVAGLLAARSISAVPVVDDDNRVIGMVSEANLLIGPEPGQRGAVRCQIWLFDRQSEVQRPQKGRIAMPLHPIADKAEISVDFPDKAYIGSFSRHSQFDAYAEPDAVAIKLVRPGEDRREATMHLHYGLLADILSELARSLGSRAPLDELHRVELSGAVKLLSAALERR